MSASGREDRSRLDGFELEIFKLVRKGATSEQWREWLRAPLEHAAANGSIDLFTRLMDAGADGSAGWRGCHGRTLLGAAACGKNDEMVRALLKAGAKDDVDVMFGDKQESALHVAAVQGAEKASKALLLAGADPNMLNGEMESPLHMAAEAGHHDVATILLLKGASPNAKTLGTKYTPLHLAARGGYHLCVSALVLGGADTELRDLQGTTPLSAAAQDNRVGAAEELLAAGASVGTRDNGGWCPLDVAAVKGHVDIARELLRHGSSVKARDEHGFTALHCAAQGKGSDNGNVINILLAAGADINAKAAALAYTPLHIAADRRTTSSGTIYALLEGGANASARDVEGGTPLHDACSKSRVGAVQLLLRWGADEDLTDETGETPEEKLGQWEEYEQEGCVIEQRKADDQRIRQMLAGAPADRSWRRRGWLVLARSFPNKVQLMQESSRNGGSSVKAPRADCKDSGESAAGRRETAEFARLVGRVVGLEADGVFRLVMSFV